MILIVDIDGVLNTNAYYVVILRYWQQQKIHHIILWSAEEEVEIWAQMIGCEFISKFSHNIPVGDVLIDDYADLNKSECQVQKTYNSIKEFIHAEHQENSLPYVMNDLFDKSLD